MDTKISATCLPSKIWAGTANADTIVIKLVIRHFETTATPTDHFLGQAPDPLNKWRQPGYIIHIITHHWMRVLADILSELNITKLIAIGRTMVAHLLKQMRNGMMAKFSAGKLVPIDESAARRYHVRVDDAFHRPANLLA